MNEVGRGDSRADTQPDEERRSVAAADRRGAPVPMDRVEADLALPRGCPFLLAEGGGWRLDTPTRDHRCAAFSPPTSLSPEKQSRLCLTAAHTSCATYLASLAARETRMGVAPVERATRWGLARTTTVVEDSGGLRGRLLAVVLDRRRWPAIPAVLLVTTLFTLALSGFRAGIPSTPVATSSPVPPSSAPSLARPTPSAAATLPSASPTAEPTAPPTGPPTPPAATPTAAAPTTSPATAVPSATFRTYVVRSGDTLSAIAAEFGTTVSVLVELNSIDDPAALSIGQVLLIP